MADAAVKAPGLSEAELKQFEKLLGKANAAAGPHTTAIRIGEPYIALVNLSVPRRGDLPAGEIRQTDLVPAGDTVYLTDDEAATYLRHNDRDGRRIPVVRKLNGPDSSSEPNAGRIHPSYLSGPLFRPGPPAPGSDAPRPDPEGASRVTHVPEATPPQAGTENITPPGGDAVDIAPGTAQVARQQVMDGASPDLVGAMKAQSGLGARRTPNDGRR